MSVGISFGSIGDIIAVGQIAWSLAVALSDANGSASQYAALIKELQDFDKALLQVVVTWQNFEVGHGLDDLTKLIGDNVRQWRDLLLNFRTKLENKYRNSLEGVKVPGSSGVKLKWLRDTSKKFLWLTEKEDIAELRARLQCASSTITMLVLSAIGKSNRLSDTLHESRVRDVHTLLERSLTIGEEHTAELRRIHQKLEAQERTSTKTLIAVKAGLQYLSQIYFAVVDIRRALGILQTQVQLEVRPGLDATWQQAPVVFEDALGNIIPVPLELVDSWEMLETILIKRFEDRPGLGKVKRGEYGVVDDRTGQDLNKKLRWTLCFRPGQKVSMSMLFEMLLSGPISSICPGCQAIVQSTLNEWVTCANPSCRMVFRETRSLPMNGPVDHNQQPISLDTRGSVSDENPRTPATPASRTPSINQTDKPADFKRVQVDHVKRRELPRRLRLPRRLSDRLAPDEYLTDITLLTSEGIWVTVPHALVSPRWPQSCISRDTMEALGFVASDIPPDELHTYVTPRGIIKCTHSVHLWAAIRGLEVSAHMVRLPVLEPEDLGGVFVILGRPFIEALFGKDNWPPRQELDEMKQESWTEGPGPPIENRLDTEIESLLPQMTEFIESLGSWSVEDVLPGDEYYGFGI